jgi:hypothetical protein
VASRTSWRNICHSVEPTSSPSSHERSVVLDDVDGDLSLSEDNLVILVTYYANTKEPVY